MHPSTHTGSDERAPTNGTERATITVDIYSDVVCPWCYIGKRKFDEAIAQLDVAGDLGADVAVRFLPFQLDPSAAPGVSGPVLDAYAKKFGGPERALEIIDHVTRVAADAGIEFRMDRALRANTLLAHRLLWLAEQPGAPTTQAELKERLLRSYFHDGTDIGDPDALADVAAELGFGRDDVLEFLESERGLTEVRAELRHAAERGVTAVPTFVFNDAWAVPGAQESDTFVQVLRKMAARATTSPTTT